MYKLTFYVPDTHVEVVKSAIFAMGAGRYGSYDCCCWQVQGQGQFRPLASSNPFLGEVGQLETVTEWRVETIVEDHDIHAVIEALKISHPYEMPAFDVVKIEFYQ
ncbi:NGG1p interacting factor NIF3 [Aquirhabdus sp.]|uniref:NGG1p interacting factor NIF3 n=1 Tax=Aquirhabdus sp. TaxID=2824160 RepID=UPI00396CBF02